MEKKRNRLNGKTLGFHSPDVGKRTVIHAFCRRFFFHRKVFLFHRRRWKKDGEKSGEKAAESPWKMGCPYQCREVMFVFSSFTVSAKAGSFFIFFSTWLMEYITVVWSRLLKSRPMLS